MLCYIYSSQCHYLVPWISPGSNVQVLCLKSSLFCRDFSHWKLKKKKKHVSRQKLSTVTGVTAPNLVLNELCAFAKNILTQQQKRCAPLFLPWNWCGTENTRGAGHVSWEVCAGKFSSREKAVLFWCCEHVLSLLTLFLNSKWKHSNTGPNPAFQNKPAFVLYTTKIAPGPLWIIKPL